MNTMEPKKNYDAEMDSYLDQYDVYAPADIGLDIAAVIRYAKENDISLSSVPDEIIEQFSVKKEQKVG